jgi:hypothetical protein
MMDPCHAISAPVVIIFALWASAAAASSFSSSSLWHDAIRSLASPDGGRSLQLALSCTELRDAFTLCIETALPNGGAEECMKCHDRSGPADNNGDSYDNCTSVNAFFCDADKVCQCMSPCREEFAVGIECVMKEILANQGKDFPCDIDCGRNIGGGTAGGGGGDWGGADEADGVSSSGGGGGSASGGGGEGGSSAGGGGSPSEGGDTGSSDGGGGLGVPDEEEVVPAADKTQGSRGIRVAPSPVGRLVASAAMAAAAAGGLSYL